MISCQLKKVFRFVINNLFNCIQLQNFNAVIFLIFCY